MEVKTRIEAESFITVSTLHDLEKSGIPFVETKNPATIQYCLEGDFFELSTEDASIDWKRSNYAMSEYDEILKANTEAI